VHKVGGTSAEDRDSQREEPVRAGDVAPGTELDYDRDHEDPDLDEASQRVAL
jgi:hypothetical protein